MPATPVNAQAERDALALFDAALDVSPDAREAWLSERCAGDTALLARVRALLHADAAGSVLASGSAVDGVAAGGGFLVLAFLQRRRPSPAMLMIGP